MGMTKSTLNSMPSFFWSIMIGLCWMYIFGSGFMLGVAQFLETQQEEHEPLEIEALRRRLSSFQVTVKYLFTAISAGHDWGGTEAHVTPSEPSLYNAILVLPTMYHYLFFLFLIFMMFALLNIVSGMFTDRAFRAVRQDRDFGILEEAAQQKMYEKRLKGLFLQLDEDGSGTITWDELEKQLDNPLVLAYFGWLGINISQARNVFDLLDLDGGGDIAVGEFLKGCRELRGPATNIEVKMLRNLIEEKGSCLDEALARRRQRSPDRSSIKHQTIRMRGKVSSASTIRGGSKRRTMRA